MKHSWVPYAAIAAGTILLIEQVIIFGSQGEATSPVLVVMYLGGVFIAGVAAIGFALSRRPGRRLLWGAGLLIALFAWVIGLGSIVGPAFEAVFGNEEYVADEGPVALLGLVLLALGARGTLTDREPALA